jgi:hypothetical protein
VERIDLIFTRYEEGADLQGWKEIDAILNSGRFVALRSVVVYALDSLVNRADDPWLMKLYEQLPLLNSKGMLHARSSNVRHIR